MKASSGIDDDRAPRGAARPVESLRQLYRCPAGHVSEVVWDRREVAAAIRHNDMKLWCTRCDSARLASIREMDSILLALGLPRLTARQKRKSLAPR